VRRFMTGVLFFLAVAACITWVGVAAQSSADPSLHAVLYTTTPTYVVDAWLTGGERFPAGAQVMVQDGETSRPLVAGFSATADPAVSFDGTKILFSGRRQTKDPWQVWEVAFNEGAAKPITTCTSDCVRPLYLPGNRLVYARKTADRFVLEASALEGGPILQLTYAPGNAMPTDVLRDGRILFEAAFPMGSGQSPEIYTVFPDGSGVESYRCDHGARRQAGKETATGDIVFASGYGLGRFTSALAHEVALNPPAGEYAGEVAMAGAGEYLVSWRPDATARYSLQRWNPATNSLAAVVVSSDADVVQPVLVESKPIPKLYPSGLHDWNYANLLCLNAYTSKYKFATGSVAGMKLYTRDEKGKRRLLGSSSVEPDGSFYVQVPGDMPLQMELLDKQGKTLQREQGWWWMRKGEQRICVGCHAGPEHSPENAVPAVLMKSTNPVVTTGEAFMNAKGGR
jgi:Hydrazine synthase alpha subunit middle domain